MTPHCCEVVDVKDGHKCSHFALLIENMRKTFFLKPKKNKKNSFIFDIYCLYINMYMIQRQ